MIQTLLNWYHRYLSHPEAGHLVIMLLLFTVLVSSFSHMLAPVFISIVLAYLLDWAVIAFERYCKLPHSAAVIITFALFISAVLLVLFSLIPLLIRQLETLLKELPNISVGSQALLQRLQEKAPYIPDAEIQNLFNLFREKMTVFGRSLISVSVASIPNVITFIVYFVMTPLLIYFFLMDRKEILVWCNRFVPHKQGALSKIWAELDRQIGNYVRGKVLEAIIIGLITYAVFSLLGLQYAALLAAGVAISVFIPYIGAVVITIPVVILGLLQWGLEHQFLYLLIAYGLIILLDGTVLVTLLFSGTNSLHPVVIIIATLVFGGIWGFWGVFFAIPLASLVKALLEYWPVNNASS